VQVIGTPQGVLVVLVGVSPLALAFHALPYTEGIARTWWRAIGATLATVVLQALALHTALSIFLDPNANVPALGIPDDPTGTFNLFIVMCLLWAVLKIPGLMRRYVTGGGGQRNIAGLMLRMVLVQQLTQFVRMPFSRRGGGGRPGGGGPRGGRSGGGGPRGGGGRGGWGGGGRTGGGSGGPSAGNTAIPYWRPRMPRPTPATRPTAPKPTATGSGTTSGGSTSSGRPTVPAGTTPATAMPKTQPGWQSGRTPWPASTPRPAAAAPRAAPAAPRRRPTGR
jgi:hypothetical protein